jgi:predicted transcriptional regulator
MVSDSSNAANPASAPSEPIETKPAAPGPGWVMKASSLDVLEFLQEVEVADIQGLMRKFNYNYRGAYTMIQRLKHEGLIERFMHAGEYCITEAGVRRIKNAKG